MSLDEEGYVHVRRFQYEKVKIPDGNVKCPLCKGSGELRRYYGQPWDRGQFETCHGCHGRGFLPEGHAKSLGKVFRGAV